MILYYIARRENLKYSEEYYENELLSYGKQFEITDTDEVEELLAHYNILSDFQETTRFRYVQEWVANQAKVLEDVTTVRSNKLK